MKFNEVLEIVKLGGLAARESWESEGKDRMITMLRANHLPDEVVGNMTSMSIPAISTIRDYLTGIEFHHQVLQIDFSSGLMPEKEPHTRATNYTPTWEDILAEDWYMDGGLEPHLERMLVERKELSEGLKKLGHFLCGEEGKELPAEKRELLERQQDVMEQYLSILEQRIKSEDTVLNPIKDSIFSNY